ENFADLAREASTDEVSAENGGDIGWLPYDVLDDTSRWAVLGLDVGEVSQPVAIGQAETEEVTYSLIMVSEKADAREMEEDALFILKSKALENWLTGEMQLHEVKWYGFDKSKTTGENVFGPETYTWIQWQLTRMGD
ncbi:unnamed protein product, partial [marine sediment metagenome]